MRNCNLQFGTTHGVQIVFFVVFYMFYVCLSEKNINECHFHRRLHHPYPAVWIKTLSKDRSTVSS